MEHMLQQGRRGADNPRVGTGTARHYLSNYCEVVGEGQGKEQVMVEMPALICPRNHSPTPFIHLPTTLTIVSPLKHSQLSACTSYHCVAKTMR